jgi:hydroxymethylpyrimidine kinase/phosphomethylpyrimidine kinase
MVTLGGGLSTVPVALTIAGSDSGGGAGIQADLKTFEAFGVWGTSAITGVTAQNTLGVQEAMVLPAALVDAQIESVAMDLGVSAAKTGMLGNAEVIRAVAAAVSRHDISPLVVDPVLVTSHGEMLLEKTAVGVLGDLLLPVCAIVTPNLPEAEAILGHPVAGVEGMVSAAEEIAERGARAVLVKGGHLEGADSTDVLWSDGEIQLLEAPRIPRRNTHGTGCTLSAAICAELARGKDIVESCRSAKEFVTAAIVGGLDVGAGVGPVNPGWSRRPRSPDE